MKDIELPVTITLTLDAADVDDILLVYQLLTRPGWEWAEIAQAKRLPSIFAYWLDIIRDHFDLNYWRRVWGEQDTDFVDLMLQSRAFRKEKD